MNRRPSRSISFKYFLFIVILISLSDFVFIADQRFFRDIFLHLVWRVCLFLIPVYFFKNHLKIYYWLLIPFIILSSLAISCNLFFNIRITPEVILVVANTNLREATELARGYILIYLLILLIMMTIYFFLAIRLPAKMPSKKSMYISLTAAGIFLLLPFFQKDEEGYLNREKGYAHTSLPASFFYDVAKVYSFYKDISNNAQVRNSFRFNAKQVIQPGERQIYILVIGESSRAQQWAINGYYRNTSPRLLKRTNLLSFPNMVSGGYLTEFAVPQIISEATPDHFELQNREKSIVSAFKEAGFKTYWISNNLDDGHIQMHAKEADEFTVNIGFNPLDMKMIDNELTRVLNKNEEKVFIVLHTIGNHWVYFERYPPAFDVFKPALNNYNILASPIRYKNLIINSYDNSVLYSDAIIDTVIALTAQKKACSFVFYTSDHGEDLLDDRKERVFHSSSHPSKYVAHIPFFVWYSDKFRDLFPEKINWLYNHKDRKIGAENIFPSLAEMGSLSFPSLDSTKSILSPSFKDSQQKILGGESIVYDYAKLLKE